MSLTDLRVVRTLDQIREAFLEMLNAMDYEDIAVKELITRADVNRKTFYRHYASLDDLLKEIMNDIKSRFLDKIRTVTPPEDRKEITRAFYESMEELGAFGERLVMGGSLSFLSEKQTYEVMQETWDTKKLPDPSLAKIIINYVSGSTLAIYREWAAEGKTIPLDEIIDLTANLLTPA
jgi:AcrR family transcriptional regulator